MKGNGMANASKWGGTEQPAAASTVRRQPNVKDLDLGPDFGEHVARRAKAAEEAIERAFKNYAVPRSRMEIPLTILSTRTL